MDKNNIERPKKFNQAKYISDYQKKHYTRITISPKKEIADAINKYCEENGINRSQLIIKAVMEYIENH